MVVEIEDAKRAAEGGAQLLGNSAYLAFFYCAVRPFSGTLVLTDLSPAAVLVCKLLCTATTSTSPLDTHNSSKEREETIKYNLPLPSFVYY
jgi:hypothetical protein